MKTYRIAVIPGDGIGQEVMPEGVRVLEKSAKKHGFNLLFDNFDFASCDYYDRHGRMMPEDWKSGSARMMRSSSGRWECRTACRIMFRSGVRCC